MPGFVSIDVPELVNRRLTSRSEPITMIGAMQTGSSAVLQFKLPFEGMVDRVRTSAEAGRVVMLKRARTTMKRDDISDIVVIRALKRCQLLLAIQVGNGRGEWRCTVNFNAKGFRRGGSAALILAEGRVLVEDIHWDPQP